MPRRTVHLVCNAHLDPVWLWQWEEGAAETLSTFRTAADFCEEFPGFVFCHNEAILYRWIEQFDPELFRRIRRLVERKAWHIMGGWHIQPDCNMPSGESFVRQVLAGKRYFKEKFGVDVTTAINLDPFGHTRGLVQILAKSGYDSYLICRPGQQECPLPSDEFVWVGFDGSEVLVKRAAVGYASARGTARKKAESLMQAHVDSDDVLVLWGMGDHGGGASREDLRALEALMGERKDARIVHSTPGAYFGRLSRRRDSLPRVAKGLNPWAVGCYTSQIRIKQAHRRLENELYSAEKMAAAAALAGLMPYPREGLTQAAYDLATAEFHDILPGSSTQPAEADSLRLIDHGLETLSRVKARAFFALCQGQAKARAGRLPIFIYNPHPYAVRATIECEFQPSDPKPTETFTQPQLHRRGRPIPSQVEKEESNIPLDWRKRLTFRADLPAASLQRFECTFKTLPAKPRPALQARNGRIRFKTDRLEVVINARTGLVDRCRIDGANYIDRKGRAFQPIVMLDDEDPWGMRVRRFGKLAGRFKAMSGAEAARFAGVQATRLAAVRVIEDGPVRSVIEALLSYGDSRICQRYKLPKDGGEIELELRVFWQEKDRMLKLSVPLAFGKARFVGQTAFGVDDLPADGDEAVAQKWVAAICDQRDQAFSCINDGIYGSDFAPGRLRLTLLRSPAYSAHPVGQRQTLAQDRFSPRIDQGERRFRLWFNGGPIRRRLEAVDREALAHNETPYVLPFFPAGGGSKPKPLARLSDKVVQVTAIKLAEDSRDLIIRLFEPTGRRRSTVLSLPMLRKSKKLTLKPFEVRTLRINPRTGAIDEVDLLERR